MPYDNVGAHAELVKMMKRGEKLSVKFGITKDLHPYAWIESKNVAGFKYLLDETRLANLINYMDKGDVIEYAGDPMQSDTLKGWGEFPVRDDETIHRRRSKATVHPSLESTEKPSAMRQSFKGSMFFRIPRTKENLDYLREMKQPL